MEKKQYYSIRKSKKGAISVLLFSAVFLAAGASNSTEVQAANEKTPTVETNKEVKDEKDTELNEKEHDEYIPNRERIGSYADKFITSLKAEKKGADSIKYTLNTPEGVEAPEGFAIQNINTGDVRWGADAYEEASVVFNNLSKGVYVPYFTTFLPHDSDKIIGVDSARDVEGKYQPGATAGHVSFYRPDLTKFDKDAKVSIDGAVEDPYIEPYLGDKDVAILTDKKKVKKGEIVKTTIKYKDGVKRFSDFYLERYRGTDKNGSVIYENVTRETKGKFGEVPNIFMSQDAVAKLKPTSTFNIGVDSHGNDVIYFKTDTSELGFNYLQGLSGVELGEANVFDAFFEVVNGPSEYRKAATKITETPKNIVEGLKEVSTNVNNKKLSVQFDPTKINAEKVVAKAVTDKDELSAIKERITQLSKNYKLKDVYDVHFVDKDGKVIDTPNSTRTVTVEYPGKKAIVFYVNTSEDGKMTLEKVPSTVKNGKVIFYTTHFSTYAISEDETPEETPAEQPNQKPGNKPSNTPGNNSGKAPSNTPGNNSGKAPGNTPGDQRGQELRNMLFQGSERSETYYNENSGNIKEQSTNVKVLPKTNTASTTTGLLSIISLISLSLRKRLSK